MKSKKVKKNKIKNYEIYIACNCTFNTFEP